MEEKQVVEQEVKAEERELTEPEMEKVVGGIERYRPRIQDIDYASETASVSNYN